MAEVKARKILVAVDDGEESMYALSWAVNNLVSPNSKDTLILLCVKISRVVFSTLDVNPQGEYWVSADKISCMEKYSNDVARSVMEKSVRLCKGLLQDVKVETKIENGDPGDTICEVADKLGADVLVMGSHGYGVIKRAFLGSVSSHCARKAKCPVLILKRPQPPE